MQEGKKVVAKDEESVMDSSVETRKSSKENVLDRTMATISAMEQNWARSEKTSKKKNTKKKALCADPSHYHSFRSESMNITDSNKFAATAVNYSNKVWLLSNGAAMRRCMGCEEHLIRGVFFPSSSSASKEKMRVEDGGEDYHKSSEENDRLEIVRCVACGGWAHRSCAFRNSRVSGGDDDGRKMMSVCPVNAPLVKNLESEKKDEEFLEVNGEEGKEEEMEVVGEGSTSIVGAITRAFRWGGGGDDAAQEEHEERQESDVDAPVWMEDGPPAHWACSSPSSLEGIRVKNGGDGNSYGSGEWSIWDRDSFSRVSKALEENFVVAYVRGAAGGDDDNTETTVTTQECGGVNLSAVPTSSLVPPQTNTNSKKLPNAAFQILQTTSSLKSTLPYAGVAGGIAGGVAGLALAGPAGAIAGYRVGQFATVLGVVVQGTMSVGVVVAGVSAGRSIGEGRRLGVGRGKDSDGVVLVRPYVEVDSAWEGLVEKAKDQWIKQNKNKRRGIFASADHTPPNKDADIVQVDEHEIKTDDKIFLLVSRDLNDGHGLVGYVYRSLIQEYKNRYHQRTSRNKNKNKTSTKTDQLSRQARQDAHGVIMYITHTLFQLRPGLASSNVATHTKTAVETLVFAQMYNYVMNEILEDATSEMDRSLSTKIDAFLKDVIQHNNKNTSLDGEDLVVIHDAHSLSSSSSSSEQAEIIEVFNGLLHVATSTLETLRSLPETRSPTAKLRCCVSFLEQLSIQFSNTKNHHGVIGADFLLKSVCQHVIIARVPNINAEVAFVEEFARDEDLLRGKEGYALVTLQASLHFLNGSQDFLTDIFLSDDS